MGLRGGSGYLFTEDEAVTLAINFGGKTRVLAGSCWSRARRGDHADGGKGSGRRITKRKTRKRDEEKEKRKEREREDKKATKEKNVDGTEK